MSAICQKSPCTKLTNVIGLWVEVTDKGWFQQVMTFQHQVRQEQLTYCPFCGTHLSEIHDERVLSRAKKPAQALKTAPHAEARKQEAHLAADAVSSSSISITGAGKKLPPPPPPPAGLRPDKSRKR